MPAIDINHTPLPFSAESDRVDPLQAAKIAWQPINACSQTGLQCSAGTSCRGQLDLHFCHETAADLMLLSIAWQGPNKVRTCHPLWDKRYTKTCLQATRLWALRHRYCKQGACIARAIFSTLCRPDIVHAYWAFGKATVGIGVVVWI